MAINTSNIYATQMTNLIKPIYLDEAKLGAVIRKQSGIIGGTYEFISGGYNMARQVSNGEAVIPNNTMFNKIQVVLQNWAAADYTSIFDKDKITIDETSYLAKSIGGALGRIIDQIIINTFNAQPNINAKPTFDNPAVAVIKGDGTFPTSATAPVIADRVAFSVAAIRKASSLMNSLGVPADGRTLALTPECIDALLQDTTVTSILTNTVRPMTNGMVDMFLGFKIITIGQRPEGGLPASTYTTGAAGGTAFAFHTESTGLAMGTDPVVAVNYIADKRSWLVDGTLSANAGVIDKNGIIKIIHGTV